MTLADRVRPILKNTTFLGELPDPVLDALIRKGHLKTYSKGQTIYRRGEPGDSMMLILVGRIKITNTNAAGREVALNFLGAGDLNGEIAVLDGGERTANAVAVEQTEAFVIYGRDLLPVVHNHPEALLEIIGTLCEKLRAASAVIEDNTLEMRSRAAKGLLRLARQLGRTSKQGIRLDLNVSQTELGHYLNLSRANVSRQLGYLRDASVIRLDGTKILILDEQELAEIVEAPAE